MSTGPSMTLVSAFETPQPGMPSLTFTLARDEYALLARTTSGVVVGRPIGRGTRRRDMTSVNAGASPAWPGVMVNASGRQRLSAARRS